jgi:hypothetical protein
MPCRTTSAVTESTRNGMSSVMIRTTARPSGSRSTSIVAEP